MRPEQTSLASVGSGICPLVPRSGSVECGTSKLLSTKCHANEHLTLQHAGNVKSVPTRFIQALGLDHVPWRVERTVWMKWMYRTSWTKLSL